MSDLNDLIKELESSIKYLKDNDELLDDLGDIAEKNIKKNTPKRTGKLQESITKVKRGNSITITSDVDYADDVEFGHSDGNGFVKGSHMFENGMAASQNEFNKKVEDYMDNILLFK